MGRYLTLYGRTFNNVRKYKGKKLLTNKESHTTFFLLMTIMMRLKIQLKEYLAGLQYCKNNNFNLLILNSTNFTSLMKIGLVKSILF